MTSHQQVARKDQPPIEREQAGTAPNHMSFFQGRSQAFEEYLYFEDAQAEQDKQAAKNEKTSQEAQAIQDFLDARAAQDAKDAEYYETRNCALQQHDRGPAILERFPRENPPPIKREQAGTAPNHMSSFQGWGTAFEEYLYLEDAQAEQDKQAAKNEKTSQEAQAIQDFLDAQAAQDARDAEDFEMGNHERKPSILERFPREILNRIFILAGPNSSLNLLNRNLYEDFNFEFRKRLPESMFGTKHIERRYKGPNKVGINAPPEHRTMPGIGLLGDFIKHHFTHDVNSDLAVDYWTERTIGIMNRFDIPIPSGWHPEVFQDTYATTRTAIDISLFNYRFAHPDLFNYLYPLYLFGARLMTPSLVYSYPKYKPVRVASRILAQLLECELQPHLRLLKSRHSGGATSAQYRSLQRVREQLVDLMVDFDIELLPYDLERRSGHCQQIPYEFFENLNDTKMQIVVRLCEWGFTLPIYQEAFNKIVEQHPQVFRTEFRKLLRVGEEHQYFVSPDNLAKLFSATSRAMDEAGLTSSRIQPPWITLEEVAPYKEVSEWLKVVEHCVTEFRETNKKLKEPRYIKWRACPNLLLKNFVLDTVGTSIFEW